MDFLFIWFKKKKAKTIPFGPKTSWQINGERNENSDRLFSWAPKSLWTMTAAMKLKEACSLEEKL